MTSADDQQPAHRFTFAKPQSSFFNKIESDQTGKGPFAFTKPKSNRVELPVDGDGETLSGIEVSHAVQALREHDKRAADRIAHNTETDYWFAVIFHTERERTEFLRAVDAYYLGPRYIDGRALARKLGVEITTEEC